MSRASVRTIALVLAFCASAQAHPMPAKTRQAELYFAHRCGEQSVKAIKACIHRAALHWGVSAQDGYYIGSRETGNRDSNSFNPNICNSEHSGACGLFQFMPGTFDSTPYRNYDIFDAKYNSLAWAWLYRQPGAPCVHWAMC